MDAGLLEGIVLSVVFLRSGRSLGDSLERINSSDPFAFSRRALHNLVIAKPQVSSTFLFKSLASLRHRRRH
jgi:hypothetical protein